MKNIKINRLIKKTIFSLLIFISCTTNIFALEQTGYVDATGGLTVRKDAGTSYKKVGSISHNTLVTIVETKKTADASSKCPTNIWYKIKANSIEGYVCSQYIGGA